MPATKKRKKKDVMYPAIILPDTLHLVTDEEDYSKLLRHIEKQTIIGVDTETTGLDTMRCDMVGLCLSDGKEGWYIPTGHVDKDGNLREDQIPEKIVLDGFKPILANKAIKKVYHNARFDLKCLKQWTGIYGKGTYFDTQIAACILNENDNHRLKPLVEQYLKVPCETYEDMFGKNPGIKVAPLVNAAYYAAKDPLITYQLFEFQAEHLKKHPDLHKIFTMEMRLLPLIVEMEWRGVPVDTNYLKELGYELDEDLDKLTKKITEIAHKEINLNSSKQLGDLLFDYLCLKEVKKTKKGGRSTDKDTLEELKDAHPVVPLILEYRAKEKIIGTYVDGVLERQLDGVSHTGFNPVGTVTGRFSSSDPNLQNIPSRDNGIFDGERIRRAFYAPDGYNLVSFDMSQIEPRILTHFSEDPGLIDVYRNGKDLYSTIASRVFDKPIEECGDDSYERKVAKVIVLAVMYGIGPKKLSKQMKKSVEEAKEITNEFYSQFRRVKRWKNIMIDCCSLHGYVTTLFGRKRRLPDIWSKDRVRKSRAMRQACNAPIQGSSADILKRAMLDAYPVVREIGGWISLTIHDELIFTLPEKTSKYDINRIKTIMTQPGTLIVPIKVDLAVGRRWSDWSTESYDEMLEEDDDTEDGND